MEDEDGIDDDERERSSKKNNGRRRRRRRKRRRRRVVFIVGATGTGKTKLSIDLARRLKSSSSSSSSSSSTRTTTTKKKTLDVVVVNMDALQMYASLPIATARATEKEREGVRHELLGVVDETTLLKSEEDEEEKRKTSRKGVRWFRKAFLDVVEKAWKEEEEEEEEKKGKDDDDTDWSVILCVGGTPYYAKAALSKTFLPSASASTVADDDADESISDASVVTENEQEENADADKLSMDERVAMHEKLRKLDPKAAARVHPKDARRVRRYLQMAEKANGEESLLPSTIFQCKADEDQRLTFAPQVTRVIHIVAENEALEKTLDRRLEQMRANGVEEEIETFIEAFPTVAKSNKGVAQAIGVREFLDENDDVETRFEKMRARTKRLARRQRKQFTNMVESSEFRAAPAIEIDATKMHELLASAASSNAKTFWEDEIVSRAMEFVTNEFDDVKKLPSSKRTNDVQENNAWIERTCEACGNRIFRGDRDWYWHTSSKRHKNRVRNLKKSREGERGSLHPNKIAKQP